MENIQLYGRFSASMQADFILKANIIKGNKDSELEVVLAGKFAGV
jgi:hypothetical protein